MASRFDYSSEDEHDYETDYENREEYRDEYQEKVLTKEELDNRQDLYIDIPKRRTINRIKHVFVDSPPKTAKSVFFTFEFKKNIEEIPEKNGEKIEEEQVPKVDYFKVHNWGTIKVESKEVDKDLFPSLDSLNIIERKNIKTSMPRLGKKAVKMNSQDITEILVRETEKSEKSDKREIICIHWKNGNECPKGEECKFLHQGPQKPNIECYFGERCNKPDCKFKHTPKEKNSEKLFIKTKICTHWKNTGSCPSGDECLFAHGTKELKTFKHKLCKNYEENGSCPRGKECLFAHGKEELVYPNCRFGEKCLNIEKGCPYSHEKQEIPLKKIHPERSEKRGMRDMRNNWDKKEKQDKKKNETPVRGNMFNVLGEE